MLVKANISFLLGASGYMYLCCGTRLLREPDQAPLPGLDYKRRIVPCLHLVLETSLGAGAAAAEEAGDCGKDAQDDPCNDEG